MSPVLMLASWANAVRCVPVYHVRLSLPVLYVTSACQPMYVKSACQPASPVCHISMPSCWCTSQVLTKQAVLSQYTASIKRLVPQGGNT